MQITPKTSVISWLPLCFIPVPSPSRAIFYKHKSDHMMPSFNFCKGTPLHLNKTEASQHGPNLLCAIHPFVSAAAMLVFFRFLMCVTHRCHTLLPSPGALSPGSFHPAGLGMSLFPELLPRSHPLKFSFPSMVSFPIMYASLWHWLLSPSVLMWFSIVGSPARLEGSWGKKGLSVALPLITVSPFNTACDTQWVLSRYLLDEWLFTSRVLEKNTLWPREMNDYEEWNKRSSLVCVNEKKLSRAGSWEHKAQGDESGTRWLEMRLVDFVISIPYLSQDFPPNQEGTPWVPGRITPKQSKTKSWN